MRKTRGLACRIYKINPNLLGEVKSFFKNSGEKICYDIYGKGTDHEVSLFFRVKGSTKNDYGSLFYMYIDKIMFLPKDDDEMPVSYTPTYTLQILDSNTEFQNYIIIFGPKTIDTSIKTAIIKQILSITENEIEDPLVLLRVNFDKVQQIAEEFPNVQHFCIKDVSDDRLQDVIIKGDMLETTPQYREFVLDSDTKGSVNFLGVTAENKLFYIGRDGSMYSRNSFTDNESLKMVHLLLTRLSSKNAFYKTLDDFS